MNKFQKLLCKKFHLSREMVISLKNVENGFANSNEESVVFYFYERAKNIKQLELFLSQNKYGLVIIAGFELELKNSKIIVMHPDDWYELRKLCLTSFYPIDLNKISLIGCTGTNGKSSFVHFLREFLILKNKGVVSVGTIGVFKNQSKIDDQKMTSPDLIYSWKLIYNNQSDTKYFLFEMSSHALDQKRFDGLMFNSISWTSFSQDHLDYHQDIDSYFDAKLNVIMYLKPEGKFFVTSESTDVTSRLDKSERFNNWLTNHKRSYCIVKTFKPIDTNSDFLKVSFNRINLGLCVAALKHESVSVNEEDFNRLTPPDGRMNHLSWKGNNIFIDYAHTPDALLKITEALKNLYDQKFLITIFGCGGNRDKLKRPLMTKAALIYSDLVILTSDNPRDEVPEEIIEDMVQGISIEELKRIIKITDRSLAIEEALKNSKDKNNIILIAGKGHETYQEVRGVYYDYNDMDVTKNFLNRLN